MVHQHLRCNLSHLAARRPNRGDRRNRRAGNFLIVESHDSQLFRHSDTTTLTLEQRACGKIIVREENGLDIRLLE